MRARLISLTVTLAVVLALASGTGNALLPKLDWVPDSWGMVPFAAANPNSGRAAVINTTRRIVADPTVPGRFFIGNALTGLYQSESGGGWATVSPHCLDLVRSLQPDQAERVEDVLHLISGCSVEGIAFDPAAALGLDVYASTFNLHLAVTSGGGIATSQDAGGVFRASFRFGATAVPTGGVLWSKLLPGIRGNAIAVKHPTSSSAATIVVGRIQAGSGDVGVDDNAFCRAYTGSLPPGYDKCTPSLYISYDNGTTWVPKYFYSGDLFCANGQNNVTSSSKLVGNLMFDPNNNNVIYAGANSGLWQSIDSGQTWQLKVQLCGQTPGFTASSDANPANQRLYLGLGPNLFVAPTGPGGAGPTYTHLVPTPGSAAVQGSILSVLIDKRDPSGRTLFIASWQSPPATGGGSGGVYKVHDNGDGTATYTDLKASFLDALKPILGSSILQYPIVFDPQWRPTLFLAQHPLAPDLLYASSVLGGVWVRSNP